MLLQNKIAVITGAASRRGIGRATARLFAENGASVAILDRDLALAQESAASLPVEEQTPHIALACDVTEREQCLEAIRAAHQHFGQIDVLVNIAGITQPVKTMEIGPDDYDAITDVNLRGTLYMSQAVIPLMRAAKAGSIICMSSVSAQRGGGIFGGPHYSAAKAGVMGLAKAMARELGPDGIRVNSIAPGLIDTDIVGDKLSEEMRAEIQAGIPLGRLGEASDVAGVSLFLASELSAYITGTVIDVNGGMLIY